jgi:hypothetical protein
VDIPELPAGSYGRIVYDHIYDPGNRKSLRQVGADIGYSYEHIRKTLRGVPVGSKAFNNALCKYFGLDAEKMWKLAQYEKAERRYGPRVAARLTRDPGEQLSALASALEPPSRARLIEVAKQWAEIPTDDQNRLLEMARAWSRKRTTKIG